MSLSFFPSGKCGWLLHGGWGLCVCMHSDPVIGRLSMDVVVGRLSDRLRSLGRATSVAWKESTVKCCCPSVGIDGT